MTHCKWVFCRIWMDPCTLIDGLAAMAAMGARQRARRAILIDSFMNFFSCYLGLVDLLLCSHPSSGRGEMRGNKYVFWGRSQLMVLNAQKKAGS
uniref:Uncharacterized protein n=1 Tax=mine drainage metagenome TaxID=410659 RepID=E6Q8V8_9ZZZZ